MQKTQNLLWRFTKVPQFNNVNYSVDCRKLLNIRDPEGWRPFLFYFVFIQKNVQFWPGPTRGGLRGYIVPGPGSRGPGFRGPGRVEAVVFSFGARIRSVLEQEFFSPCPICVSIFGEKWDQIWVKTFFLFFRSSPNFGEKMGPNLSEDLFFCSSPNFGEKMGPNLSEDLFFFFLLFT